MGSDLPRWHQCRIDEFCFSYNRRAPCHLHRTAVEIQDSSSDVEEVTPAPQPQAARTRMANSIAGIQTCSALSAWTPMFWHHLLPEERTAWQGCSYFIRSDCRLYCRALPVWSKAQHRILDPPIADHSIPDSEIDTVYETLPRKAG